MKITIVNEFKYCYGRSDIGGLAMFIEPDTTLEFDSLKKSCEIGIDHQLIDNLSKSKFLDLFNEALVELFSENIIKPEDERTVFISPYQTKEPKVKWKSDRVEIFFADSFHQNQTYIISLSSNLVDLRKNKIEDKMSIAFSTGTEIDAGTINGHLYLNKKPQPGLMVALFDQKNFKEHDNYDSLRPQYIAQTNNDGLFDFIYITLCSSLYVSSSK